MIGSGGVFAALRTLMLQTFPIGTKCTFNGDATMGNWLETGTFLVLDSTKRSVVLQANPLDYSGIKLNEVESLLNHALEHIWELIYYFNNPANRSESWIAVTAYYLGFFSASTILRLVGIPIIYLPSERLRLLRTMLMSNSPDFPGGGSFKATIGKTLSASSIEVILTSAEKTHEATWKSVLGLLQTLRKDKSVVFAADEANFYDSLCSKIFCAKGIGLDWPSDVRNKINYRPGLSYRLSRPVFHVTSFLAPWRNANNNEIFKVFNSIYRHCSTNCSSISFQVEMATNVSIILYLIARSLYSELRSRQMTDTRWETQRNIYKRRVGLVGDEFRCVS